MKGTFFWSVRRELWEHRAIILAPLVVSVVVLAAVAFNVRNLQEKIGLLAAMDPAKQQLAVTMPFGLAALVVLLTAFVVGAFYCFDSLNNERRDRSLLFWKSMPVSDTTAVLSKAFIPLAVQPAWGFLVAIVTQLVLLVLICIVLLAVGIDVAPLWARLPVITLVVTLFYGVIVHVLWYAPLYALFIMMSAWVRRPILWVVLPVFALPILERIAFGTSLATQFMRWRLTGAAREAFKPEGQEGTVIALSQLDPGRFLSSPGLWLGLAVAAVLIYIAIRLRRAREPF
jgi:ABC-2 type transport system permease protein